MPSRHGLLAAARMLAATRMTLRFNDDSASAAHRVRNALGNARRPRRASTSGEIMQMRHFAVLLMFGAVLAGCGSAAGETYPNQLAAWDGNTARPGLVGWSQAPASVSGMRDLIVPDNPAFDGAMSFFFQALGPRGVDAARMAFESAGMTDLAVEAARECSREAVQVMDSHADSRCHAVMVSGKRAGADYRGVAMVLYGGSTGAAEGSGVHAFMAPGGVYAALGGNAIIIGRWMTGSAAPATNMLTTYGQLSPATTVESLDTYFTAFMAQLAGPSAGAGALNGTTTQIQMQTIDSMRNWGNATMDCSFYSSCDVIDSTGQGGWVSSPDYND